MIYQIDQSGKIEQTNKDYVLFTFCAALSLLLKRNLSIGRVIIDKEYFGKEAVIKEILLEMMEADRDEIIIEFSTIGKRVNAHIKGYLVFKGKLKPGKVLDQEAVLKAIKKTEVGKQLKNT